MRRIVIIVTLVVLAAIVVGGYLFYRDAADAEAQSTASALEDFRPDAASPGLERPGVPAQGVYELSVAGDETIGSGPISFTRDLPDAAPLIVRHLPQGYETETRYSDQHTEWVRYEVLEAPGRSAATALVPGAGAYAEWAQTRISASTISRTQPRDWRPPPLRLPVEPTVGQTWSGDHRSGDLDVRIESRVEREDVVDVAGESVPVVVVRSTQMISGEYDGTRTEHFWYSPADNLVVRYQIDSSVDGPVDLDFTADQRLRSLTPQG